MARFRSWLDSILGRHGTSDEKVRAEVFRLKDEFVSAQSSEEKENMMAEVRRLAEEYPEAVLRASEGWEDRWAAEYEKALQGKSDVDLSGVTSQIREQMGWPQSGSVRELAGPMEELAAAVDYIEAHGGKVPPKEATKIIAALDPDGPEARFLAYRAKKIYHLSEEHRTHGEKRSSPWLRERVMRVRGSLRQAQARLPWLPASKRHATDD